MSPLAWLILVGILLAFAIAGALAWPWIASAVQAHRDYRRARGTLHRAEIERSLVSLEQHCAGLLAEAARVEQALDAAAAEVRAELERALAEHLVRTRLDDVPGVGGARLDAIRRTVFHGRLRDLLRADDVPGIGPQTAAAIAAWVAEIEAEWPALLAADFPGKSEIAARYADRRALLERERAEAQRRVAEVEGVAASARAELARLRLFGPGDFRRSLRANGASGDADLRGYVLGVFPPWAAPPPWYAAMIEIGAPREG